MQTVCTDCGGTVIEYDAAAGNGFCVQCGTVVEENTIVNEVRYLLIYSLCYADCPAGHLWRDKHGRGDGSG